jgi:hypothetical protein
MKELNTHLVRSFCAGILIEEVSLTEQELPAYKAELQRRLKAGELFDTRESGDLLDVNELCVDVFKYVFDPDLSTNFKR